MSEETKTATKTIWKFPIEYTSRSVLELRESAEILHVGEQMGDVCLWAKVDPSAPEKKYLITAVGTGHDCPEDLGDFDFLGTVIQDKIALGPEGPVGVSFVWHIWGKWA